MESSAISVLLFLIVCQALHTRNLPDQLLHHRRYFLICFDDRQRHPAPPSTAKTHVGNIDPGLGEFPGHICQFSCHVPVPDDQRVEITRKVDLYSCLLYTSRCV